jgi:hypothetical protein
VIPSFEPIHVPMTCKNGKKKETADTLLIIWFTRVNIIASRIFLFAPLSKLDAYFSIKEDKEADHLLDMDSPS